MKLSFSRKKIVSLFAILMIANILIVGCATRPSNIMATSTSPQMYGNWNCDQISNEMFRLNDSVANLTAQQNKLYKNDQVMGWVGTFLLWPMYLFIKGDGAVAAELARDKGQLKALQQMAIQKNCN